MVAVYHPEYGESVSYRRVITPAACRKRCDKDRKEPKENAEVGSEGGVEWWSGKIYDIGDLVEAHPEPVWYEPDGAPDGHMGIVESYIAPAFPID